MRYRVCTCTDVGTSCWKVTTVMIEVGHGAPALHEPQRWIHASVIGLSMRRLGLNIAPKTPTILCSYCIYTVITVYYIYVDTHECLYSIYIVYGLYMVIQILCGRQGSWPLKNESKVIEASKFWPKSLLSVLLKETAPLKYIAGYCLSQSRPYSLTSSNILTILNGPINMGQHHFGITAMLKKCMIFNFDNLPG